MVIKAATFTSEPYKKQEPSDRLSVKPKKNCRRLQANYQAFKDDSSVDVKQEEH